MASAFHPAFLGVCVCVCVCVCVFCFPPSLLGPVCVCVCMCVLLSTQPSWVGPMCVCVFVCVAAESLFLPKVVAVFHEQTFPNLLFTFGWFLEA